MNGTHRYSCIERRGVCLEWVSEPLGGCLLISVQCMWESHERRFPPEAPVIATGKARKESGPPKKAQAEAPGGNICHRSRAPR